MVFFESHGLDGKHAFRSFHLQNKVFPFHFHRAYELVYVKNGQLSLSIDDLVYPLKKKDLAFIFPNQMHAFKSIDRSDIMIAQLTPELIGDFHRQYQGLIPEKQILSGQFMPEPDQLQTVYHQKSYVYGLCAKLIGQSEFSAARQSQPAKLLYKILLYIDHHYAQDCNLKAVAAEMNYDYPYISKLFTRKMQMTFTEYLNDYRISQACYLLKNSSQPISEIAASCGYNNLRTFHRNFNRIMRTSPQIYRKTD